MNQYRILIKGILEKDGKILIVQKWYDDNIVDPFQWEFPESELLFGESLEDAVMRILLEQTSVESSVDRILYTWNYMTGSVCNIGMAYLCHPVANDASVQISEELHDSRWISREECDDYLTNPRIRADLTKAGLFNE